MNPLPILALVPLLAQEGGQQPAPNPFGAFLPIILMFVIFYFVLIRPQRKRQRELQQQIEALRTGDHVITVGGMHGIVANIKDKTLTLKVADNVRIDFEKSSVQAVTRKKGGAEPDDGDNEQDEPKGTAGNK